MAINETIEVCVDGVPFEAKVREVEDQLGGKPGIPFVGANPDFKSTLAIHDSMSSPKRQSVISLLRCTVNENPVIILPEIGTCMPVEDTCKASSPNGGNAVGMEIGSLSPTSLDNVPNEEMTTATVGYLACMEVVSPSADLVQENLSCMNKNSPGKKAVLGRAIAMDICANGANMGQAMGTGSPSDSPSTSNSLANKPKEFCSFSTLLGRSSGRVLIGQKSSLNLTKKKSRTARKDEHLRQCAVLEVRNPSIDDEIDSTTLVGDLIGVSLAGVSNGYMQQTIQEEKADIRRSNN